MWFIRYKDTKEPLVMTSRIGYAGPGGEPEPAKGRPIKRRGSGQGVSLKPKKSRLSDRKSPRARDMPHGCKRIPTRTEKAELEAAVGVNGYVPVGTRRCSMCGKCGKYYLPYRDMERIISAFRGSRMLEHLGISIHALECVNECGKTMQEMKDFPVQKGYALRHAKELWYWQNPTTEKVWYKRACDAEAAWRKNDTVLAVRENRKPRRNWGQQRFVMVHGSADSTTSVMVHYV